MEDKELGNQLFKEQKWEEAAEAYGKGLKFGDSARDVRGLLLSNRSQCNLNLERWDEAYQDANACLELLPSHTKSLYRRALALEQLGKKAEAAADFIKVVKMEPTNKAAADGARRLRTQVLDARDRRLEASLPANVIQLLTGTPESSSEDQQLEACRRLRQCAHQGLSEALIAADAVKLLIDLCAQSKISQELRACALAGLVALASSGGATEDVDETDVFVEQAVANPNEPLPVSRAAGEARNNVKSDLSVPTMMRLCHGHAQSMAQHCLLLGHVYELEDVDVLIAMNDVMSTGLEGDETDAPRAGVLSLLRICDTRRRLGKQGKSVVPSLALHQCLESAMSVTTCPDLLKMLLASVFALLADDDRPKGEEVNLAEEALKVLEPFLQSSDHLLRSNGLGGLSVFFEANPKSAAKLMRSSAVPLMAVVSTLSELPGTGLQASLQEDAANCMLYAASELDTRLHLIESGTVEMLISMSTEESGASRHIRAKLIGVLAVLAAHSKEVREEVFDRVDFLVELSYALTVVKEMKETSKGQSNANKYAGRSARARDLQRLCRGLYESCACLSIHAEFKQMLVQSKKTMRAIQDLVVAEDLAEDPTLAFSYVSLVYNLCLSRADKVRPKNTQFPMSELGDDDLNALEEAMDKMPAEMKKPKNGDVDAGSMELAKQMRSWCVLLSEEPGKKIAVKASHASPVIVSLSRCVAKGSAGLRNLVAHIFKFLCVEKEHRLHLVSSGGVRTLLKLIDLEDEKARDAARQSLAQICIVTNPALFQYSEQLDAVRPLAEMLEHKHELMQFEGAMALTNLLIVSEELRSRAIQADVWRRAQDLLFSENEMVQRAGLEAMCNLCMAPEIIERVVEGKGELDLKLLIAFAGSEDVAAQNASAGALAMLSDYPEAAAKIAASENFQNLLTLVLEPQLESGVQHRIVACLTNLYQAGEHVPQELRQRVLHTLKEREAGFGFQSKAAVDMVRELVSSA